MGSAYGVNNSRRSSYAWFPALRFRSSVAVGPISVLLFKSRLRKNYVHP